MKKSTFLLIILLVIAGTVSAQTLPEGMVSLLPDGVKVNINDNRKKARDKNLTVAGSKANGYKAFFAATDGTHGEELWVTNGTPEGTFMVKDINPGSGSSDINYLTRFNDKVVFAANDGQNGSELWISDGTENGTYMVKNIHEFDNSEPKGFVQVNEKQFVFAAKDFDSENYGSAPMWWLWVSDGTEAGTRLIYECDMKYPGQDSGAANDHYCRVGRKVFFKANLLDGSVGEELWLTDGTREGTFLVKDINWEEIATGTANSAIDHMLNFYNEKLFFKAWTPDTGNEPWASDGTPEGTYMIYDSDPTKADNGIGRGGNATSAAGPYNGKIYFRGRTPEVGYELGCTNLDEGNYTIFDIQVNEPTSNNNSYPDPGVEFDGVYMFCANSGGDATLPGNYGGELHYTDGERVYLQSDLAPGVLNNWVKELTVVAGSLYWWNESGDLEEQKQKLFRIDNKNEFPVRVCNLGADGDGIHTLRNLNGILLFTSSHEEKPLYAYTYRKEGYDPEKDADNLEIEFRTRAEIENETAINTVSLRNKIAVYPNPTSDIFRFDLEENVLNVCVFDLTGRIVKQEIPLGNAVNVSSLTKGMYKVVITTAKGTYISSLIIK